MYFTKVKSSIYNYLIKVCIAFKNSFRDFMQHGGGEHSGYLAFLSIFAIFPFFIFLVSILGVIGESTAGSNAISEFLGGLPHDVSNLIAPRINEITSGPPQSIISIAFLAIIWTASSLIQGMNSVLNKAYRVEVKHRYLRRRLQNTAKYLVITVIVLGAIFVFMVVPSIIYNVQKLPYFDTDISSFVSFFRVLLSFVVKLSIIAALYMIVPNVTHKFRFVFPGTVLTMICFKFLSKLLSFYLVNFGQLNLVYGSLTGVLISLLFFYLISAVFIFGAEFNYNIMLSEKRKK